MNSSQKKLTIRILVYIIGGVLLLCYIWIAQKGFGIPCLFRQLFSINCPSCGATRSALSIMSGDLGAAIEFNPVFTLALYPIAGILAVQDFFVAIYRVIKKKEKQSMIEYFWHFKTVGVKE